ncbi:oligosaccharide flippase family protein [candidate division KSB1 bacterium]|nr:oligosaccharide flippase family protein [candidate division KSB1 bacterium]
MAPSSQPLANKFFRQIGHYSLGNILIMLSGFISLPLLTRIFSKSQYGYLSLIMIVLWMSLTLTKAGLQESAVRFYTEFKLQNRPGGLNVFYSTLLLSSVAISLGVVASLWAVLHLGLKNRLDPALVHTSLLVFVWIFTGSIYMRLVNFLRAAQKTGTVNIFLVLQKYVGLALSVVLLLFVSRRIESFIIGQIAAETILIAALFLILFRDRYPKSTDFSPTFFKECLAFGLPFISLEMSTFLIKSADRFLLQLFMGAEAVAVYSVGSNLCLYLRDLFMFPLAYTITPLFMELWNEKGKEATIQFISTVFHYAVMAALPLVFGFIALSESVVFVLASEKYLDSVPIIPYLLAGSILWGFFPLYSAGIYIHKKTKYLSIFVFISFLFNGALNIILIPRMQLVGAAIATLVTYLFLAIILMAFSHRYLEIRMTFAPMLKMLGAALIMYKAVESLPLDRGIVALIVKPVVGMTIYGGLMIAIDKPLRQRMQQIIRSKPQQSAAHSSDSLGEQRNA